MLELLIRGGPLIWPLLACGVIAIGIFLERFFHYHRARVPVQEFLTGVNRLIAEKRYPEVAYECAGTPGPVARIVHLAVTRHDDDIDELRLIIQHTAQLEVPRLERYLFALLAIAYIAPLLGLFGTVAGLLTSFESLAEAVGADTPKQILGGVHQALISAALGLAVAIPVYLMYAWLLVYCRDIINDMERAGIEVTRMIQDSENNRSPLVYEPPISSQINAADRSTSA